MMKDPHDCGGLPYEFIETAHRLKKPVPSMGRRSTTEKEMAVPCKCAVDMRGALEFQQPISLLSASLNV